MKLATFETRDGSVEFGAVVEGRAVSLSAVGTSEDPAIPDIHSYLRGMPASVATAEDLLVTRGDPAGGADRTFTWDLSEVRLLSPLPRPAALLDCGMSPRHLANSSATLLRRSLPGPLGIVVGGIVGGLGRRAMGRGSPRPRYYKGNHNAVIGDGDTVGWPSYTAYLDIEPELAFVTGTLPCGASEDEAARAIAGYLVFNDASARDVQLPEMFFTGPASSKDFDDSNGLGPFLVTSDDVGDPLALGVTVEIRSAGERARAVHTWTGSTSEYSMSPVEVLCHLAARQTIRAGTVVGMGTIPNCCGLDRDEWVLPGDEVAITFERLGTLHQKIGEPTGTPRSRWADRPDLGL